MITNAQLNEWAQMLAEPGAANHFYGYLDHRDAAALVAEVQQARPPADALTFRIVGIPKSKGSMSPFIQWIDGEPRARLMEKKSGAARKALDEWRAACARVFKMARGHNHGFVRGKYLQPVAVSIQFSLPRPKSAPSYVEAPTTYPDLDKLERVILDELKAAWLVVDDRQIVEQHNTKVYAADDEPPGATVRVWPCDPPEKEQWK